MHLSKQWTSTLVGILVAGVFPCSAQLFENLRALGGTRYSVGDPAVTVTNVTGDLVDGPKDIVVRDLDGDGQADLVASDKDGSVTIRYGSGDGTFGVAVILRAWTDRPRDDGLFSLTNIEASIYCDFQPTNVVIQCYTNFVFPPFTPNPTNRVCVTNAADNSVTCSNVVIVTPPSPAPIGTNIFCQTNFQYGCVGQVTNLHTNVVHFSGPFGLRGLAVADFTGDGLADIAAAAPGEQVIYIFRNGGGRQFSAPTTLPGWFGVRDLATGDFDGDGRADLVAAGTTNGVVQFRSLGGGQFQAYPPLLELASTEGTDLDDFDFPQPAYYLKTFRYPGETRDEMVVSFAQRRRIWSLRPDGTGRLAPSVALDSVALTSLDVGPIRHRADSGAAPDLVTAYSREGRLDVFSATEIPRGFSVTNAQRHFIPGAPRNVRIVDLDQDGWNDVVVVAQLNDRVLIYRNNQGNLTFTTETFAGRFPREMDIGYFNADTHPDLAVLNRYSSDISVFLTATNLETPVGFLALDSIYPVDGSVSGLDVIDFNRDGRPDVMQLHRDSSEFSVRLTGTDGRLAPPTYYAITNGFNPAAQIATDVNSDGLPDMVSANLSGSVTVRLGRADGTFEDERTYVLPPSQAGQLFALVPGDFDRDGKVDLAAGYLDCRITFFKGDGSGGFTFVRTDEFIYEPRSMVTGDLDQDGDLDIVGGSLTGQFVVIDNRGDLFTTPQLPRRTFIGTERFDTNLRLVDQNGDGDPDLLFGYPGGFSLYLGSTGLNFTRFPVDNGGNDPRLAGNTFVFADLNGDGRADIASICSSNSCLSIQIFTNNQYVRVLTVPVPLTLYLATGDLDKDGFADLVGSGDVLWVALSSRKTTNAPPSELLGPRGTAGVVINEVLPANSGVPLSADAGRDSDFVELYNASPTPALLTGWRMLLVQTNVEVSVMTNWSGGTIGSNQLSLTTNVVVTTNSYGLPAGTVMAAAEHRVLVCNDRIRTPFHTGYNLPAEGGTLLLLNQAGIEVNRVSFPALDSDLAYARYTDGARRFVVNNIPSPGSANVDNGAVLPTLSLTGVDLDSLAVPEGPIRFRAYANDDIGLVNVSLLWRRLDVVDTETKRVVMYDDGINEDGPANDGAFLGILREPLLPGAEIQFYLECTDITGQVETSPGSPRFVTVGQTAQVHALAIGATPPALEISEIVADNATGLVDERGGRPDWVEIRNVSGQSLSLVNVSLGPRLFGNSDRMSFTNRPSIAPGEHVVIFADGNPSQGQLHAPFQVSRLGGQLFLIGSTPSGARYPIDAMVYGPQAADIGLSRLGRGGAFWPNTPTPRAPNVTGPWQAFISGKDVTFAFPTRVGVRHVVEGKGRLNDSNWMELISEPGNGAELIVRYPEETSLFLRVSEE